MLLGDPIRLSFFKTFALDYDTSSHKVISFANVEENYFNTPANVSAEITVPSKLQKTIAGCLTVVERMK